MNNEIKLIDEREVLEKNFRVYGDKENPLFLAKDIAVWLEMDSSSVNKMLGKIDEDERLLGIVFRAGQNREMWFLTEDGLYEVLMQSRKPVAKKFKKEVKAILKQIRKTGGYIPIQEEDDPETIMAKALIVAQNTLNKKDELLKVKEEELNKTKVELEATTAFIKRLAASTNSLLVRQVAKIASDNGAVIGERKLWNILREWGLIFKNTTEPKQKGIDAGLFEVTSGVREATGKIFTYQTTRVTGKGQAYIIERLLKEIS